MSYLVNEDELLESSTLNHIQQSKDMILEGLRNYNSGNVLILGGGKCTEIPISALSEQSEKIDLVELNYDSLSFVKNHYDAGNLNYYHADLTGVIEKIRNDVNQIRVFTDDPRRCLEIFARLLSNVKLNFWYPAHERKYEFVVASCILTQLQAYIRKELEQVFLKKFPEYFEKFLSNEVWRQECKRFAINLEIKFIQYLNSLIKKEGIIYLSDTVRVSWLSANVIDRTFCTDGYWLTIEKEHLSDYMSINNKVLVQKKWKWLRLEKEDGYEGRLYDVQAILYKLN